MRKRRREGCSSPLRQAILTASETQKSEPCRPGEIVGEPGLDQPAHFKEETQTGSDRP